MTEIDRLRAENKELRAALADQSGAVRRVADLLDNLDTARQERDEAREEKEDALDERNALSRKLDELLWLHAEATWQRDEARFVLGLQADLEASGISEDRLARLSSWDIPTPDDHTRALAREVLDEHEAGRVPLPSTVCELAARVLRAPAPQPEPQCECFQCVSPTWGQWNHRMVICPECGNKRCPHATWHGNACTGSNKPGQPGSRYPSLFADEPTTEEN